MKIHTQTPKIVLNKSFLKQRPLRSEIETFKNNLKTLLAKVQAKESEENKKNHVRDFLLDTYYKGRNEVNTKDRKDLVIHLGKTNESKVGVIIEAKTPESADMVKRNKLNAKAFHELILYYFDERHAQENSELKNLAVTNVYEWFIFDANVFDKQIYRHAKIKRLYETYKNDKKDNPFFYEELRKIIENLDEEITCTHFDLKNYRTFLDNDDLEDDKNLIELYKILSPHHLLKEPFAEDSNQLNKQFYDELLHIIGLEEIKIKSKSIIRRKESGNRDQGSLLENAITMLKSKDSLRKVKNLSDYGASEEEQLFNIALELCLTWINRILFLKLLEAQLVNYHRGDREFRFLNIETIPEFDELFTLFHQVLAKTLEQRDESIREKYKRVPYLNSSLFEISELEDQTISIESLKDTATLSFNKTTILKRYRAENKKLTTLEYLFKFLDAYDFASEGVEDVQDDNRSLINASVLGKVFEKINGYKDGSIFTPGFITMYMCRQAIRLAVVQKFKDRYGWNISQFEDIGNYLKDRRSANEILEFNELINSLHLCDPAVGSGHFLVSSLNEIIAIKCELGILADETGVRLSDYEITIENDELIITNESGDIFEYQINEDGKPTKGAQRLQKTLFREKQMLIENCLFGVDINPNSVKICRLRLWIELLKNAYYRDVSSSNFSLPDGEARRKHAEARTQNFTELETLPNIDINIKEGNSLLSRFALDEDLKEVLKSKKGIISTYRNAVAEYKRTRNRDEKRNLLAIIDEIKGDFRAEIYKHDPKMIDLAKKERRLFEINSPALFEKYSEGEREVLTANLEKQIAKTKQEIEDIKSNAIYKNAFEWRFEFPEVLDDEGNFVGFDIVIGNPPYINVEQVEVSIKEYLKENYDTFYKRTDLFSLFIDLAITKLTNKQLAFIVPSIVLNNLSYKPTRNKMLMNNWLDTIFYVGDNVFEDATVDTTIIFLNKFPKSQITLINALDEKAHIVSDVELDYFEKFDNNISVNIGNKDSESIISKLYTNGTFELNSFFEVFQGIVTGNNPAYIFENEIEYKKVGIETEILEILLHGRDIGKWQIKNTDRKIIYINSLTKIEDYPNTLKWLENFKEQLIKRRECAKGVIKWFSLQWSRDKKQLDIIPKILIQNTRNERLKTRIVATIDTIGVYGSQGLNFVIPKNEQDEISVYYLLAILNSKIINYLFANKFLNLAIKAEYVKKLPIKKITPEEQKPFMKLVDEILEKKKLGQETSMQENKIDAMVYRLYDLTDEEIAIVEGK